MLTFFMILSLVLSIIFLRKLIQCGKQCDENETSESNIKFAVFLITVICLSLAFVVCITAFGSNIYDLSTSYTIDDKIAIYEKENRKIEKQIEVFVESYMEQEENVYTNLSIDGEDAFEMVFKIPKLQSYNFVLEQIEVYSENNKIIKELELKKSKIPNLKFALYFGR